VKSGGRTVAFGSPAKGMMRVAFDFLLGIRKLRAARLSILKVDSSLLARSSQTIPNVTDFKKPCFSSLICLESGMFDSRDDGR